MVMLASAGTPPHADHRFAAKETAALFEQLVVQLQEFPAPPTKYRPQVNEPLLVSDARLRIVTGFSGAGKTAWVAQAAMHTASELAYFDIGDNPGTAISIPLARDLAGRFFGKGGGLGEILLPGASGIDMLRALGIRLKREAISITVVIDNAHRGNPDSLSDIINCLPDARFVLLCQPGPTVQELEARLHLVEESLQGWSLDTIAADASDLGCRPSPGSAQRLLQLTAGLPLYVQNAAQIASKEYGGDIDAFCSDIEKQTHSISTAQEIILAKTFTGLPEATRNAVAALSITDIPLAREEVSSLLKEALGVSDGFTARFVRELRPTGALEFFGHDRVKIHDAMRLIGRAQLNSLGAEVRKKAYLAFRSILMSSVPKDRDLAKLSLLIRVFAEIGEIKPLVEFATDEWFHELGVVRQIYPILEDASTSETVDPAQRFSALDGLVFSDLKEKDLVNAERHLKIMIELAAAHKLDADDHLTLAMKEMLVAAARKDAAQVIENLKKAAELLPDNPLHRRIYRYNAAHALYQLGYYEECVEETSELIEEYYDVLGLTFSDVMGNNPDKIWPILKKGKDHTDDLKHLADCLDLQSTAADLAGLVSPFGRIHAVKFYSMANAVDSLVRVGQDLADQFVGRKDYIGAREVMERNVIPNVTGLKLTGRMVPVRSQYAVILAYCGDFTSAEREMAALAPYESGLSAEGRNELKEQRALIARMRIIPPKPQWQMPSTIVPPWKIGRNERCPCGSGKKYKKCHGNVA
ncbi:MAG TPA: SEC-C metal-binding domain-containing protein [Rhizomicrobium sp.]|jgi:tetratricopeptide (TPR) repeat protein|nr:SEC-C metal-binding domain-containing protein [Rhizomicrobium sp.]